MTERISLQPIGLTRTPITVRDYSIPGSIVFERRGDRTHDNHETPFYAGVSGESAIALRDFLLERFPLTDGFEPRTVQDLDGDVWIEVEPDSFKMEGICKPRPLDEIERLYGIDDEQTFEPRTIVDGDGDVWVEVKPEGFSMTAGDGFCEEVRSIDYVASTYGIDDEETSKPDVVRAGEIRFMTNSRSTAGSPMPAWDGTRVEVLSVGLESYNLRAVDGRPDGVSAPFYWHADGVDLVKEEPLAEWERLLLEPAPAPGFQVGDRVRVTGDTGSQHELRPYTRAKVVDVMAGTYVIEDDGTNNVGFRFHEIGARYVAADEIVALTPFQAENRDQGYLAPKPQEAGDPTGSIVFVTDDSEDWGHDLEPGTAVEIVGDDYLCDGSYEVRPLKDRDRLEYVGASDLALESGLEQKVPTGSFVRVTSDGRDEGLRHYLEVGSIARVIGWLDTSAEKGSRYSETYEVEGKSETRRTITQSLAPGSFGPVEKGTAFEVVGNGSPRHFLQEGSIVTIVRESRPGRSLLVKGSDLMTDGRPACEQYVNVADLKPAPEEPVRFVLGADPSVVDWSECLKPGRLVALPEAEISVGCLEEPVAEEPKALPRVGDYLRVTDPSGDSRAKEGDVVQVESVDEGDEFVQVRREGDDVRYGMFSHRFEAAPEEAPSAPFKAGDRVKIVGWGDGRSWDGPATVTDFVWGNVHVRTDDDGRRMAGTTGAFAPKFVEPLSEGEDPRFCDACGDSDCLIPVKATR